MRLSWIFALIVLLLLGAVAVLWYVPDGTPRTFIHLSQGIVGLSLILVIVFYRNVIKPIHAIGNGIDLIKGQDFSSRLAHVHQPEADGIVDMFNQMMKSLKEQRLQVRERNHLLDLLIDISPMGIVMLNPDTQQITDANAAASRFILGKDNNGYGPSQHDERISLKGRKIEVIDTPLARHLSKITPDLPSTVTMPNSMVYRCSLLSFMDRGIRHPFYLIESLTDEVRRAERQSYEKIIRVIAHEINNSMTGVDSILSTLCDPTVCKDAAEAELLQMCRQRCRSLSQFITAYATVVKIPEPNLQRVSLCHLVEGMRVLLDSMCTASKCQLEIDCAAKDAYAMVDTVLMEQALINIVKNSIESIGETQGVVTIKIGNNPPSITVIDNGAGISSENAQNLFTPFFSTKDNGQGIGLMFVSEALRKQNATIELRTHLDGLTRFTINF